MTDYETRGGRLTMPRSRGAASGLLLVVLGIYGALIPFVGPYLDFAFTPDQPWAWTTARGWLEVLPGAATALGGFLLLTSGNRLSAMLGGWLAVLGGAWFVVGRALAGPLGLGNPGSPVAVTDAKRVTLELAYFGGLGALIILLAAMALGRLSVRSVRDVAYARRPLAGDRAETRYDDRVDAPPTRTSWTRRRRRSPPNRLRPRRRRPPRCPLRSTPSRCAHRDAGVSAGCSVAGTQPRTRCIGGAPAPPRCHAPRRTSSRTSSPSLSRSSPIDNGGRKRTTFP